MRVLDQYLADLQAGRAPDRPGLLAEHPELAAQLEPCLGGIEFIHQAARPAGAAPVQLGDFRIVREIGRGGMGVVYEAQQLSLGRSVALKVLRFGAADQYTVWTTDANGNFLSQIPLVSGSSAALQSLEPAFQQDLNGNGSIPSTTSIESLGSTRLVQIANAYLLNPIAGSFGPQLKYGGAVVTAGQFGGWTPVGAEQTGSGYQIAWKMAGSIN